MLYIVGCLFLFNSKNKRHYTRAGAWFFENREDLLFFVFDKVKRKEYYRNCLLYTSDAADDLLCVDLGGRRIIKKKKTSKTKKKNKTLQHNTKNKNQTTPRM